MELINDCALHNHQVNCSKSCVRVKADYIYVLYFVYFMGDVCPTSLFTQSHGGMAPVLAQADVFCGKWQI